MNTVFQKLNHKIVPSSDLKIKVMEKIKGRRGMRIGPLTTAAVLVLVLIVIPLSVYADELLPVVEEFIAAVTRDYFVDGVLHIQEGTDPSGNPVSRGELQLGELPDWLIVDGDRVYFAANGEYIDITDQISTEEPFTYEYTDPKQITSYMAVGRCGNNGLGWMVMRRAGSAEKGNLRWLSGGHGSGYWNNEKEEPYGWYMKAFEELGIKDRNHLKEYYD